MSEEFEEMERIPWTALAASTPDPRRRLAIAAIGVVAVVVFVVIVASSLLESRSPLGAATEASTTTSNDLAGSDQPSRANIAARETSATLPPASIYSEADLMATAVDDEVRVAAMWAKRFVRDYLTVDGDGSTATEAAQLVGAELPAAPAGSTSFVEWIDAYSVAAIQPARYRVEVGYRLLTGSGGVFVRQPAAAMAVAVDVDVDGTATIAGLPELVTMPGVRAADPPALTDQIPDWVSASVSGDGSSIVGGYREGDDWRVVLMSEIAPGVVRPHIVSVEG